MQAIAFWGVIMKKKLDFNKQGFKKRENNKPKEEVR